VALACWAVAVLALPGAVAAAARDGGERVASLHLDAVIQPDGALAVTEMIAYDFGTARRPGIDRTIQTRQRFDDRRDLVYELTDIAASSPSGAPDELRLIRGRSATTIRVGDPAVTVTGRHRYQLHYVLHGAMTALPDRDELVWPATGTRWRVPVSEVAVTVHAPGGLDQASCTAGAPASRSGCALMKRIDERQVTFRQPSLGAGAGLTVMVGLAKGVVSVPPPVLVPAGRWPWDTPPATLSYLIAGAVVAATAAGGWLLWLRDRRDRWP
jgi:hypothetical protein